MYLIVRLFLYVFINNQTHLNYIFDRHFSLQNMSSPLSIRFLKTSKLLLSLKKFSQSPFHNLQPFKLLLNEFSYLKPSFNYQNPYFLLRSIQISRQSSWFIRRTSLPCFCTLKASNKNCIVFVHHNQVAYALCFVLCAFTRVLQVLRHQNFNSMYIPCLWNN